MAKFDNFDERVDAIVESIKTIAEFVYWYIQSTCFRTKVNSLYKKVLVRKYESTDTDGLFNEWNANRLLKKSQSIEGDDLRLVAPIAAHNNYLTEARAAIGATRSNV